MINFVVRATNADSDIVVGSSVVSIKCPVSICKRALISATFMSCKLMYCIYSLALYGSTYHVVLDFVNIYSVSTPIPFST